MTETGKKFATIFILFGVGTVLYSVSIPAQSFNQKKVVSVLGDRRKSKEMGKLTNQNIVCGGGRVGRRIVKSLQNEGIPQVLIVINEKKIETLASGENLFVLNGDATVETNT